MGISVGAPVMPGGVPVVGISNASTDEAKKAKKAARGSTKKRMLIRYQTRNEVNEVLK